MVHLLKSHRIFHPRHHHGKVTVQATFRTSVHQMPTNQQHAHSVVQEESNHVEDCQQWSPVELGMGEPREP